MRELANMSARTAIDSHVHKRWARAALGKFAVALVGLVAGIMMLRWPPNDSRVFYFGGIAGLVIAVFWGLQSAVLTTQVWKVLRKSKKTAEAKS
jgi:hypothetical protein